MPAGKPQGWHAPDSGPEAAERPFFRAEPGETTFSPWVLVTGLAVAGVGSLWHAKRLKTDHQSSEPVWPWVVVGVVLLGIAGAVGIKVLRV